MNYKRIFLFVFFVSIIFLVASILKINFELRSMSYGFSDLLNDTPENFKNMFLLAIISFITSLISLVSLISTIFLSWRKDKRDMLSSKIENKKMILEIVKLKKDLTTKDKK